MSGHVVAVLVLSPEGVPLVYDEGKPRPVFWKLPGGKSEAGETPEETAIRELEEETGIRVSPGTLKVVSSRDKKTHMFYFFCGELTSLPSINKRGNEGERVAVFLVEEILSMVDFFPPHYEYVRGELTKRGFSAPVGH